MVNCPDAFRPVEGSGEHVGTEHHHTMTRKWRRERYKTLALLSPLKACLQCPIPYNVLLFKRPTTFLLIAYKYLGDAKDALNRSTL